MAIYQVFSHTADVGIRGIGKTVEEAFVMAATALTSVIAEPESVDPAISVEINCEGENLEFLLFEWLNAIIFEMSTRKMLFSEFEITLKNHSLYGIIKGEKVDPDKHDPRVEVKGATLTELKVKKEKNWIAQCILDV